MKSRFRVRSRGASIGLWPFVSSLVLGCSSTESPGGAVEPGVSAPTRSVGGLPGESSATELDPEPVGNAGDPTVTAADPAPTSTEEGESPTMLTMGETETEPSTPAGADAGAAGGDVDVPVDVPPTAEWRVLSSDGGYSWFESPRALVHGSELVVSTVANGVVDPSRRGDVELLVHDLESKETTRIELHDQLEADDHDSAALVARPDGRLLAAYAKHDGENLVYYRISEPDTALEWGPIRTFVPTAATRVTYSNLHRLSGEGDRIYDFYRGLDASFKPSYALSDDGGETWQSGNVFIDVPSTVRHRPYVSYASNGVDTIHFLYTDGHPRDFDNSLHHAFYRGGTLFRSDGTPIRALTAGLAAPDEGTTIFEGQPNAVPWTIQIALDSSGSPHVLYSVQVGSAGLPTGQGGDDIRYRVARFDGQAWQDGPLAFGGSRLYAGEDDYSGLAAFDPEDPYTVYLSSNADPARGTPLVSAADGQRHHELFVANSTDGGATWAFTPLTRDSTVDRLRPMVVQAPDGEKILIVLSGAYDSYVSYRQSVLGLFFRGSLLEAIAAGNLPDAPP